MSLKKFSFNVSKKCEFARTGQIETHRGNIQTRSAKERRCGGTRTGQRGRGEDAHLAARGGGLDGGEGEKSGLGGHRRRWFWVTVV